MASVAVIEESHGTFARALANPKKKIRSKTIGSLISYAASVQVITEMEMLKLWEALYYSFLMADDALIQSELALAISTLFRSFTNREISYMYYRMYYRTVIGEWTSTDQARIKKLCTLTRFMLREGMFFMQRELWSSKATVRIMNILKEEALLKTPNGLRFYICEIYLEVSKEYS